MPLKSRTRLPDAAPLIWSRFGKRFTYRRLYCLVLDGTLPAERDPAGKILVDLDDVAVREVLGLADKVAA
jgi:hypothetical protein